MSINVLLAFARPKDSGELSLLSEFKTIRRALKETDHGRRVSLTVLPAASIDDLRAALMAAPKYQILHISSHGSSGRLEFEDERGERQLIKGQAFAEYIKGYAPPLQCVILNGCETLSIAKRLSAFLPFAIAMKGQVDDEASRLFSQGFYEKLGAGFSSGSGELDIPAAFKEGVRNVRLHTPDDRDETAFTFKPHLLPLAPNVLPSGSSADAPAAAAAPRTAPVVGPAARTVLAAAAPAPLPTEVRVVAKSLHSGMEVPITARRDATMAWLAVKRSELRAAE